MVWVDTDELIRLQRGALRAWERGWELEAETARVRAEAARLAQESAALKAESRALELRLAGQVGDAMTDLPLTADGSLHEPAFVALMDGWRELEAASGTTRGEQR